ncbi:hypothetical protein LCGC14_0221090 [marine sediment metagenome]|uniref:Uncharacterized protein n=1 Tax=marine sediment metagenome TaxID=412755 RepID=A0A0F9WXS9_9ZZZZ
MSWSLKNMIDKMSDDRREAQLQWNREFPPDIEVDVVEDAGITITYGIWKVPNGDIFFIPKSKSGYQPERRINIDKKIVEAIRGKT